MHSSAFRLVAVPMVLAAAVLGGCAQYVKKTDFDAAIAKLQANDQQQQQQLDALTQDMQQRFAKYDAKISEMAGRINVDTAAHFAYNDAALREQDKPMLNDFAKVIGTHYPNALITVEGFADPSGSVAYNKHLGTERAQAVRDYLVSNGLSASQLRVVSYGEARNRQVEPGKSHDEGAGNRRVNLVVDLAGAPATAAG